MCLQRAAVELIPPSSADRIALSDDHAALAFVRCYSRYRMNVDDARSPYSIEEFKKLAKESPAGLNRIDATYQVVVQNVKHTGDLREVECWQQRHLCAIEQSRSELDDFSYLFAMSRYHRVGGFIPQMRRDAAKIVFEMDLAEQYALKLPRSDETYRIAADEALYPVMESRTREALWLNESELALSRATRAVALTPYDSRAWLLLGEVYLECDRPREALAAYRRAARFAPPGGEIAWFMAGQCYEMLDDPESACDSYLSSLKADPLGISAAEQLEDVACQLGHATILSWVRTHLAELRRLQSEVSFPHTWPYKEVPPPLIEEASARQHASENADDE
jgi:tetratricopeptide (TPR) repeat protein